MGACLRSRPCTDPATPRNLAKLRCGQRLRIASPRALPAGRRDVLRLHLMGVLTRASSEPLARALRPRIPPYLSQLFGGAGFGGGGGGPALGGYLRRQGSACVARPVRRPQGLPQARRGWCVQLSTPALCPSSASLPRRPLQETALHRHPAQAPRSSRCWGRRGRSARKRSTLWPSTPTSSRRGFAENHPPGCQNPSFDHSCVHTARV